MKITCNKDCCYVVGGVISFLLSLMGLLLLYLNRLIPNLPILVGAFTFTFFFIIFGICVYLKAQLHMVTYYDRVESL